MTTDTAYTVELIQKGLTLFDQKPQSPLQRYKLLRKGKDFLV